MKDDMNFPSWAPPKLVDIYHKKYESEEFICFRNGEDKRLIALTTNPEMERVWKMLYSKRNLYKIDAHEPKHVGDGLMSHFLFTSINGAFCETKRKFTTRNEDVLKYQKIAKAARLLIEELSGQSLDHSLLHWFPDDVISTILKRDINPDKASGFFCLAHDEGEIHKKGGIYEEVGYTDKKSGDIVYEHWRVADNTNEFFNKFMITPKVPLTGILKSLASDADKAAKKEGEKPRVASKYNTSELTIFIRALYPFWLETFGSPLYRTFATICCVVFDDIGINEYAIRDALRGYKIPIKIEHK
jgi:hypothetical protein